jgi:hypothetical protein
MDLIRRNPRLKALALKALQLRIPPTALHRLLLLERTARRTFFYELVRINARATFQGARVLLAGDVSSRAIPDIPSIPSRAAPSPRRSRTCGRSSSATTSGSPRAQPCWAA